MLDINNTKLNVSLCSDKFLEEHNFKNQIFNNPVFCVNTTNITITGTLDTGLLYDTKHIKI